MTVAFLGGQKPTFTGIAARETFPDEDFLPLSSIWNVAMAVEEGRAEFGVVPLQNCYEGEIPDTLYALTYCSSTRMVREVAMPIVHCLGALPDAKIKRILSRDQAIRQCKGYISQHYPHAVLEYTETTGKAVEKIIQEHMVDGAAIAPESALDGLEILAKDICPNNRTRFIVLGRYQTEPSGDDKTFLTLHPHRNGSGVLYGCLKPFAEREINMEFIQSRSDGSKGWYYFDIEIVGHEQDGPVRGALDGIREFLDARTYPDAVKIFGSYKNTHWKDG